METNAIFRKNYGSFRRFFSMLGKADLPYLWIIGYLAASAVIANVGLSATEYSAALFAGNVGLTAVVLPYLFYQILSLILGSVTGLINNLCVARMDRNLRRMVWRKTVSLPLRFYENNNPKELLSRILDSGVIDVKLSDLLPPGVEALAQLLRRQLQNGTLDPFCRRIVAQDGSVKNDGSRGFTAEELLHMDWLCENIEGNIPEFDEIEPFSQPMVRELGVHRDRIPLVKEGTL